MNANAESTGKTTASTPLHKRNRFTEGFERSSVDYEPGLYRVGKSERGEWDSDCAGVYGHVGEVFKAEALSDPSAWEWF